MQYDRKPLDPLRQGRKMAEPRKRTMKPDSCHIWRDVVELTIPTIYGISCHERRFVP